MTAGDIGLVHPSLTLQHLILVALLSLSQHRCPYRHIGVMPPVVVHFDSNITCRVWKSRLFPFQLITFLRQSFLILSSLLYIWKPTEVVNSDSSITILRHCSWEAQCTFPLHDPFSPLWLLHLCYLRRGCPFISTAPSSHYRKAKRDFIWQRATLA